MKEEPSLLTRILAKRCDLCPACRYARSHPETAFGRLMAWHGSWCPFWRAWTQVHGQKGQNPAAASGP
jgi:hypothetical protein